MFRDRLFVRFISVVYSNETRNEHTSFGKSVWNPFGSASDAGRFVDLEPLTSPRIEYHEESSHRQLPEKQFSVQRYSLQTR